MNLDYTLAELEKITGGTLKGNSDQIISSVFIDSRNHFEPDRSVFFAIKGVYNDGHDYLEQLYKKGLRNFVVNRSSGSKLVKKIRELISSRKIDFSGANVLFVDNTLDALQALATYHRNRFKIPVIAITGSNGKTVVKEWLYHFLREHYNIVRSPKSYNSQVGVPLSVLQINGNHTLAIFEAGISQEGEMEKLERIIQPTIGVLTNIGVSHSENFKSREHIEKEKEKLFRNCDYLSYEAKHFKRPFQLLQTNQTDTGTTLICEYNGNKIQYSIPFLDEASIKNSLTCVLFLLEFGIAPADFVKKTESLFPIAFRLESRKGRNNSIIIDDFYNSDLGSLRIALDYLDRFDKTKKRHLVLSDIKSDEINGDDLYKEVASMINARRLDSFIGVGSQLLKHRHYFDSGFFYENTEQYLSDVEDFTDALVLLKGAHDFRFEQISEILEEKTHQTILEINLRALSENINRYKKLLQPQTKMLAMVKAFGYGAGISEVAIALQHANTDYLGVAYSDEGVELRNGGIDLPVIVMNAEQESYDELIKNTLEPSIYSFSQLDSFIKKLIGLGVKDYPVHIKLDTGMNRLGFYPEDLEDLVAAVLSQPEVRVKSVFTHLAASDDPKHDDFTLSQITLFNSCTEKIENLLGYGFLKHVLNSSGIERFAEHQLDMVRLGLGMYGVSGISNVEVVGSLFTTVTQVKKVKSGDSVGYGRSEFAKNNMEIAILPIGYADGFSRIVSNRKGHVLVNGITVPVVGKVCMDMTMIDVTGLGVKEGDRVEIFGKNRPIEEVAKEMGTIPYEVMTSISQRVVRVYVDD